MAIFRRSKPNDQTQGLTPEDAVKATITVSVTSLNNLIESSKELFKFSIEEQNSIFMESVKARLALLALAVNTHNPELSRPYYDALTKEAYAIFSLDGVVSIEQFAVWEEDLRMGYLSEQDGHDFIEWTQKYQNTFQMKPYEAEGNATGKPIYRLTYKLLGSSGVSYDEANIEEVMIMYLEACGTVIGMNQALLKNKTYSLN